MGEGKAKIQAADGTNTASTSVRVGFLLVACLTLTNLCVYYRHHAHHVDQAQSHADHIRAGQHGAAGDVERFMDSALDEFEELADTLFHLDDPRRGVGQGMGGLPGGSSSGTRGAPARDWTAEELAEKATLQQRKADLQKAVTKVTHLEARISRHEAQLATYQSHIKAGEAQQPAQQELVDEIPEGSVVWVTFSNGADKYATMMMNWAKHVRELGVYFMVIALDEKAARLCASHLIPYMMHHQQLESGDFRQDFVKFRKMGAQKPLLVNNLLFNHNFGAVVLSDTDVVWRRSPAEFMEVHPAADIFVSTDCLSAFVEYNHDGYDSNEFGSHEPPHGVNRCGHLPRDQWGWALNTGTLIFRRREPTKKFLEAWHEYLNSEDPAKMTTRNSMQVTDQLAFNILMAERMYPAISANHDDRSSGEMPKDWRPIKAWGHRVAVMPLPVTLFLNGHVAFLQHLDRKWATSPYMLHATFQRQHTWGKVARFRENGYWLMDSPRYFSDGDYLSYDNGVHAFVDSFPDGVPDLHKHMMAGAYQIAAFRDALAIAHELDRIIVLPKFYCWCDQDWYASVLWMCSMAGSDFRGPFECPTDVFLNIYWLEHKLPETYRFAAFLESPLVPNALRQSRSTVSVLPRGAEPTAEMQREADHAIRGYLKMGTTGEDVSKTLHNFSKARILHLKGHQPGTFGGWESSEHKSKWVDGTAAAVTETYESRWCCSAENHHKQPADMEPDDRFWWQYPVPPKLGAGPIPIQGWKPPVIARPEWCDQLKDQRFLPAANHPCTFLAARADLGLPTM